MKNINIRIDIGVILLWAVVILLALTVFRDNKTIDNLNLQIKNTEARYKVLDEQTAKEIKDYEDRVQLLKDHIDQLNSDQVQLNNVISELQEENESLKKQIAEYESESSTLSTSTDYTHIEVEPITDSSVDIADLVDIHDAYQVDAARIVKLKPNGIFLGGGIIEIDDNNPKYVPDPNPVPTGPHLTKGAGVFWFGNQMETYYNLDMSVVVRVANQRGIKGNYWIRSDGCKMLGIYIMIAANYNVHPYGSIVRTSLGLGVVVDTGGFAAGNPNQVDIAVTW